MEGEKLGNKDQTTTITSGRIWIQLPSGGGYEDYWITVASLLNEVTTQAANAIQLTQYTAQTASFTHSIGVDQKLWSIDLRLNSGSASVKVGTSVGGSDIIPDYDLSNSEDDNFQIGKSFQSATTLYVTITGTANIDCNIWFNDF